MIYPPNKNLRIAMTGIFPLDPEQIPGGVEAVIKNLFVNVAQLEGLDLHLVTCIQGLRHVVTKSYHNTTLHYLPGQGHLGNISDHILEQRRIASKLKEIKPDLIHAHGTGRHVAAAQRTPFPLVITVHGIRFREVVLSGGIKGSARRLTVIRLEKKVLAKATHIFTIADYVRKAIAPLTDAEFFPIANPVNEELFKLKTSDDNCTILSVATIQPRKGLINLVEALALVRREVPTARLHIIGKVISSAYAQRLQERIKSLNLQKAVQLRGFVSDSELRNAFTNCTAFALCSVEESSPVSIAEAMTLGKPVVATAVGGIPDLVTDGESGYLVPYGDIPATACALGKILRDKKLRTAFSHTARQRAEKDFHPYAIATRTRQVYRHILQTSGVTR